MSGHLGVVELIILAIISLILLALFIFAWARVFAKAGYSPLLCILMLVPVVAKLRPVVCFFQVAYSKEHRDATTRRLKLGHPCSLKGLFILAEHAASSPLFLELHAWTSSGALAQSLLALAHGNVFRTQNGQDRVS